MIHRFCLLAFIALALGSGGCAAVREPEPETTLELGGPAALPTQARLLPTLTAASPFTTFTPIPTSTSTPALPPTSTPVPTVVAGLTPTPVPVDRTCPDPAPEKPDYVRYHLGPDRWPEPRPVAQERIWLEKPLPEAGRFLTNTQYPYGYDAGGSYLIHNGIDSAAPLGTPVLAVADGRIVVAQSDDAELFGWRCNWYGQLVVIELDSRWLGQPIFALYGHVLEINVDVGDRVRAGDQLAEVGFGGAAIVPHLHFELRVGANHFGRTRNPMLWTRPTETRGIVAGRVVDPSGRPWQGVWLKATSLMDGETEYITWTYLDDPDHLVNPDDVLGENFVLADMLPGKYRIYLQIEDVNYQADVTVVEGTVSSVEIVTRPAQEKGENSSGG